MCVYCIGSYVLLLQLNSGVTWSLAAVVVDGWLTYKLIDYLASSILCRMPFMQAAGNPSSIYNNNYNNNCYSGIIKANYSLLDLVLTQIQSPCYKTYIELKLKLSNKCLKLLVEVASAILLVNCSNYWLNECFLRSVLDRYLNNLNWWPLVRWLLGVKVNKSEILKFTQCS